MRSRVGLDQSGFRVGSIGGLIMGVIYALAGCGEPKPTEAEQKQCFDAYIEEHRAKYPVETLKKTAALKCYS